MMVNSPLAIYSVVIGAKLYDDIFNIIVSFGILYPTFRSRIPK